MEPVVTIGIPTYNRPQYLEQAIRSALRQDCRELFEILVVDDGSNEETRAYLQNLKDQRIRVVIKARNEGTAAARNTIVEQMQGQYLLWLDDDDMLAAEAISRHLANFALHTGLQVSYADIRLCDEQLAPQGEWRYRPIDPRLLLYTMLFYDPIPNGGSMSHRSVFERVGRYDPALTMAEDYEFWTRAAAARCRFAHCDAFLYHYRSHPGSHGSNGNHPASDAANSEVVLRMLQRSPLEEIFTLYDWERDRKRAAALALATVAIVLCRYRRFEPAEEALQKSRALSRTAEALAAEALLSRARGNHERAAELLLTALAANNRGLYSILQGAGFLPS